MVVLVTEAGTASLVVTELRGGVREADGMELHADPARAKARMDAVQAALEEKAALNAFGSKITNPLPPECPMEPVSSCAAHGTTGERK